jgi:serine O-acetyltransferase
MMPHDDGRIHDWRSYRAFLAADLKAHNRTWWLPVLAVRYPELNYQRALRRTEFFGSQRGPVAWILYAWSRLRLARLAVLTGVSIPPGVFGKGLSIAHVGSIVVNDGARAGEYCRIHSATNIGVHEGLAPSIGDRVYIGPGAVIYGGVFVGDDAVIGANAVVNADVPAGVTVGGIPARVISSSSSAAVLPAWMTRRDE